MNIGPAFKLGMNVKEMTHFSTTKDAVIFPEKMKKVVRTKDINGEEALNLEDVLLTAGMRWEDDKEFVALSVNGSESHFNMDELVSSYLVYKDGKASLYINDREIVKELLRIEKL